MPNTEIDPVEHQKLLEQVELLTDRLEVMAQNFMTSVNEATIAKAEVRRLTRAAQSLQQQVVALTNKKDEDNAD